MRSVVPRSAGPTVCILILARRAVARDQRPGLGLAVALAQRQPERGEEQPDVGVERRAARHQRLQPPAEARRDPLADRRVEQRVVRPVGQRQRAAALVALAPEAQRGVEQGDRRAALLLDALADARARSTSNSRGTTTMIVGRPPPCWPRASPALGIMDRRAEPDRGELAAGMFIGVAEAAGTTGSCRAPASREVLLDDLARGGDVLQDHAVVLPDPARRAAGAAGVDQAGEVGAPGGDRRARRRDVGRLAGEQRRPVDDPRARRLRDAQRLERDDQAAGVGGRRPPAAAPRRA